MLSKKLFLFSLPFLLLITASSQAQSKLGSNRRVDIAALKIPVQKLYYTSVLEPIETLPVVSPVAGTIASLDFTYGQKIKSKQLLFVLSSSMLADNYRKAINDYLQKKQAYQTNFQNALGMKSLYEAGAISKNDYRVNKSQLDNAKLDFLQAQYELEHVLAIAKVDSKKIEVLSIANTETVNKLLQRRFRHLEIVAPGDGIALFPEGKSGDAGDKLTVGSSVKKDQLLLLVGDLSGLSALIKVSEVDIYRIHAGMPVKITGSAFPGVVLNGFVSSVSAQAAKSSGSGLSMYAVTVKIPNIDSKVMDRIRVGMTAKFEIDLLEKTKIMLPVSAVHEKNGESFVTVLDAQGHEKEVSVITGRTTVSDVVIESGIKPGDKVIVHD